MLSKWLQIWFCLNNCQFFVKVQILYYQYVDVHKAKLIFVTKVHLLLAVGRKPQIYFAGQIFTKFCQMPVYIWLKNLYLLATPFWQWPIIPCSSPGDYLLKMMVFEINNKMLPKCPGIHCCYGCYLLLALWSSTKLDCLF